MSDVKAGTTSRRYESAKRSELARRVRETILEAARALFLEQGYPVTTMEQIAVRAGVSRPTVYTVGQKAQLFMLVRDRAIAGDYEPTPMSERPDHMAFTTAADAETSVRAYARASAVLLRRLTPMHARLREAAAVDDELARLWSVAEEERLTGARIVAEVVSAKGPLRRGLDRERAAELVWTLNAPEHYERLVLVRGWTHVEFASWHAETLVHALLPLRRARRA